MPRKDNILDLPGFAIKKVSGENPLVIDVHFRRKARCIYCNNKFLRKKSSFFRCVRHESIGHKQTMLRFKAYKFYCNLCHRYFNQQFPGIGKFQRATQRLHRQIFYQHTQGISQKDLATEFKLGKATIERWYHRFYFLENQKLLNQHCPFVLGIDEHFFTKKFGYATTLCDLRKHRVFDVVKGRSASDLGHYLSHLKGREQVKVICMDLSSSYRHLVQRYFPQAKIVADRFHVIRLILHQCLQTYQELDPSIKYYRGLLNLLRTNPENLTQQRLLKRDAYLLKQPAIHAIYQFKQKLHRLLMLKTVQAKRCKVFIPYLFKYAFCS